MAPSPFEQSEKLTRLIGDALVRWNEIEDFWRRLFPYVLFQDFRHPTDRVDPVPTFDVHPSQLRAYALWDALNSSAAQLELVLAAAPVSLTSAKQANGLKRLLEAGKLTHEKRALRNAVAHSGYERKMNITQLGGGRFTFEEEPMSLAENAHSKIRGKDPYVEIPNIIAEFRTLRERVRHVYTWLVMDYPKDADPASEDTTL
jgi:hypothetical protein